MFERIVKIETNDIGGGDVTLMLCFDEPGPDLYSKQFPLAWKVSTFSDTGHQNITVTYKSQLMFARCQTSSSNIVYPGTWIEMDVGKQTTLVKDAKGAFNFTTPVTVKGAVNTISATNKTGALQDIAVGFVVKEEPNPALIFTSVGDTSAVKAEFHPVLKAYITTDFQENQMITAEIETQAIWTQNLADLAEETVWQLTRDENGKYSMAVKDDDASVFTSLDKCPKHPKVLRVSIKLGDVSLNDLFDAANDITENLAQNRYRTKFFYSTDECRFELDLPDGTSCVQAFEDLRVAMDSQSILDFTAVDNVDGQLFIIDDDGVSQWAGFDKFTPAFVTA